MSFGGKRFNVCLSEHVSLGCTDSGGARGVMAFIEGNGHGDTSSNSGRD